MKRAYDRKERPTSIGNSERLEFTVLPYNSIIPVAHRNPRDNGVVTQSMRIRLENLVIAINSVQGDCVEAGFSLDK